MTTASRNRPPLPKAEAGDLCTDNVQHADVNIAYNVYIHLFGDSFEEMYEALRK